MKNFYFSRIKKKYFCRTVFILNPAIPQAQSSVRASLCTRRSIPGRPLAAASASALSTSAAWARWASDWPRPCALCNTVVAISTSPGKRVAALAMGPDEFIVSKEAASMVTAVRSLHLILDTVAGDHDVNDYLPLLKRNVPPSQNWKLPFWASQPFKNIFIVSNQEHIHKLDCINNVNSQTSSCFAQE